MEASKGHDDHAEREVQRPLALSTPFMSGPDVRKLQEANNSLFNQWGLHEHNAEDGEFGPNTARKTDQVAYLLGLESQGHGPHSIGNIYSQEEQTLIRWPERRTDAQKERGSRRVKDAQAQQREHDQNAGSLAGARAKIAEYCKWGVAHAGEIHYAQQRPMDLLNDLEHLPIWDDCSEFATKAYKFAGLDDPNGLGYGGSGFTGTMYNNGKHISAAEAKVGDLVEWGGYPGSHVVIYAGGGMCWSHGQESGPLYISIAAEIQAHAGQSTNYLRYIND